MSKKNENCLEGSNPDEIVMVLATNQDDGPIERYTYHLPSGETTELLMPRHKAEAYKLYMRNEIVQIKILTAQERVKHEKAELDRILAEDKELEAVEKART